MFLPGARELVALGFTLVATDGTAVFPRGVKAYRSNGSTRWRRVGRTLSTACSDGGISIIINTTEGWQSLQDSKSIRRTALTEQVPYFTTAQASLAAVRAIAALRKAGLEVRSLQSYHSLPAG